MSERYEWSESGLRLMANVEQMIKDNGGYSLYKNEVILENTLNKYSPKAMALKVEINRLRRNAKKKRRDN